MRFARFNPSTGLSELFAPQGEHVERFRDDEGSDVRLSEDEKDELGSFDILAYSGAPVERWWGQMIVDTAGISHDKQTTLLLEHNDHAPIGVCMEHEKTPKGGLRLRGHFLSAAASPEAARVRLQCRSQGPGKPGIKLKSSIGIRFKKYRFLKEDEEIEVNGRTFKFSKDKDTLIVEKSHLFENSAIYVNPADLGTQAEVMHHGANAMSVKSDSATGAVLAASLPASPAPPSAAPTQTQAAIVARFADLPESEKRAALDAAKAEIARQSAEFAAAFPDAPDFRQEMLAAGKTVEQAKIVAFDKLEAKRRDDAAKAADTATIVQKLQAQSGRDGTGFSLATAERREAASVVMGSRDAEVRLRSMPGLIELHGEDALRCMQQAIRLENRRVRLSANGDAKGVAISEEHLLQAARSLLESMPPEARYRMERLAGAQSAIDMAAITVKGFLDSYHNSMATEQHWGVELCYMLDSNQQVELTRWLGYYPQLQVLDGSPEEAQVPTYSFLTKADWYDHSVAFDVQDWLLQKFGKLDQLVGQSGAVASKHWTKLAAALLELNPKGYDGVPLFSLNHAMGGKAPALQSNDLSTANGQGFCNLPDLSNITESQFNNVLLQAAPYINNFFAANGEPLNEESKREYLVLVPEKWAGVAEAAVYGKRLDGSPGGAGGGRDNPLQSGNRKGDTWRVQSTPRLSQVGTANQGLNYIYVFLLGNDRKPLLRSEPIGLQMYFSGLGSPMHQTRNKVGFWGRSLRGVYPGAWSSALRIKLGA